MIETQILGDAVGIQRGQVIDKSETTALPSLANGVIVGRFKRGRMDKSFTVTANNYQALLGHDPSNPNYLAVEDLFALGVSEVNVRRLGSLKSADSIPFFVFVDPTGQSGTYLTISKNDGPFKTFNLADPSFDPLEFRSTVVLGRNRKSAAFGDYPAVLDLEASQARGISGMRLGGRLVSPEHPNGLAPSETFMLNGVFPDEFPEGHDSARHYTAGGFIVDYPFKTRPEKNVLTIKPTEGVAREMDIYYSIPNAVEGGVMRVQSESVIDFF